MSSLYIQVEQAVEKATGTRSPVVNETPQGGGCINHASIINLKDGRRFFLKWNPSPLPAMFEREAEGLQALHKVGVIRVPQPVCTSDILSEPTTPFIVMEAIATGRGKKDFFESFGHRMAMLHRNSTHDRFGFHHDNYIGSTPQPNDWDHDWVAFFRDRRLGFQIELAKQNGLCDASMSRLGDRLLSRLDSYIATPDEPPCLLHGDLWSGNYMTDESGKPVLIDPAAYYGRREADLAMTMLFGGFNSTFYKAYEDTWPLEDGSEIRLDLYKLYHLLNHLNLFGTSYRSGCMAILKRCAG